MVKSMDQVKEKSNGRTTVKVKCENKFSHSHLPPKDNQKGRPNTPVKAAGRSDVKKDRGAYQSGYGNHKECSEKAPERREKKGEKPGRSFGSKKQAAGRICTYESKCGGCKYITDSYEKQLMVKQKQVESLLGGHCRVNPIIGMENPFHYRNKVHAVFDRDSKGNVISGTYREGSHQVVNIDRCMIEDEKADEIVLTIRELTKPFKIRIYDEDTGYGLLRHVLVKRGFATNQIMVVLVTASPIFPSRNNFIKVLRERHPEITTIIQNINQRGTSMILGDKENILYGKGFIEDILCGCTFRISSKSFYQINPIQTEKLYEKAMKLAGLTGKETVIDAYSGIGTIGLIAAGSAKEVIGVELNKAAVKDAKFNAKINGIQNAWFYGDDAGKFMLEMANQKKCADIVFMDPPRSGSTEEFINAVTHLGVKKVVYISCNPITLERDLSYFEKKGYTAKDLWVVDLFPWTSSIETVMLLTKKP